jgi:hypothetical protein
MSKSVGSSFATWLKTWPWWAFIGVFLAIVSLALWAIQTWFPQVFHDEPLRLDETRTIGLMDVRVTSVECGKTPEDLAEEAQQELVADLPEGETVADLFMGQICLAELNARNATNDTLYLPALQGTLLVQDDRYDLWGAYATEGGPSSNPLFPNQSRDITFVFDIPEGISPSALELSWQVEDEEDDAILPL